MKLSLTVVILFTTLLCVLPFIWFVFIGKNTARKNEKIFNGLLKEHSMALSQKEQWNNNFIGIDEIKKVLMFIKLESSEPRIFKIDLNEVKSCQINKITREYKRDKKVEFELQSLQLELTFNSSKPKEVFSFFDIQEQFSEDLEMKRTEKWQQLINQNSGKNKTNIIAA